MRRGAPILGLGLLAGCALKGDVRKVELQVQEARAEVQRLDSARAADRDAMLESIAGLAATLVAQQQLLGQLRGDVRTQLQAIHQEISTLQELTGQSQQRLSELRRRLDVAPAPAADSGAAATGTGPGQMYELSLQQYRRGSLATARAGFREFLRTAPQHERVPDALFYIGETFAAEHADSAAAVYEAVVRQYPRSSRAPAALYKLGLLAEQRGDVAAARSYFSRVVVGYPRTDEANLARDKLQRLGQ